MPRPAAPEYWGCPAQPPVACQGDGQSCDWPYCGWPNCGCPNGDCPNGCICPNCGGELVARPRRPAAKLAKFPASTERVFKPEGCARPA